MLNVVWFQPFKLARYSVGVVYLVEMNLPRHEQFKVENVILVGVIPGPHEPSQSINTFLSPLVDELFFAMGRLALRRGKLDPSASPFIPKSPHDLPQENQVDENLAIKRESDHIDAKLILHTPITQDQNTNDLSHESSLR